MKFSIRISVMMLGILVASAPFAALAQYGMPGTENTISITMSPEHPVPGDRVHLTAQSTLMDLSQARLTWTANGKTIQSGIGMTSADVTLGTLGAQMDIILNAALGSTSASAEALIIPTQIDLLFESDSFVPPFYQGRALPSAGTNLRLQAIVRFRRPSGTLISESSITYTWKRNDQVVASVSGVGKSSATLPSPVLFGTDIISVDAQTNDGSYSGTASVAIPSTEPVVMLYQDHPLFGLMYHKALGVQSFIPESEMTFAAIPYFAQARSANDPLLQYEWQVNSKNIVTDTIKPSELTIDAGKSGGSALISLSLTHVVNMFMSSAKSWRITFSTSARNATNPTSNNPFEQGQ